MHPAGLNTAVDGDHFVRGVEKMHAMLGQPWWLLKSVFLAGIKLAEAELVVTLS